MKEDIPPLRRHCLGAYPRVIPKRKRIIVPAHKPIKRSTLSHILKQARISVEEFLNNYDFAPLRSVTASNYGLPIAQENPPTIRERTKTICPTIEVPKTKPDVESGKHIAEKLLGVGSLTPGVG